MKILALEFSSSQRSVAVVDGDAAGGVIALREAVEGSVGTTETFGLIERVLQEAGLEREAVECLAIGLGPGSYTGIRVAIALAQGWQLARNVKLLGLRSAECVAAQAQAEGIRGRIHVVIDAQRNEFYLASYELGGKERRELAPLRLATMDEAQKLADAGDIVVGPEVTRWFLQSRVIFPHAGTLGKLALGRADFTPGAKLDPIYLREAKFVKAPPPRVIPALDSKP